ncbi:MAG TPA: ATP-binding cassette domain-containing protein [Steroidobacteraceae bacterium]|nr:ATP-binding cassette domain-containing protein [Steroidobacteraceae bacterium]
MEILLDRLRLHRGGRVILDDICWRIGAGERWLVIGATGAGKTQLLKIVAGDVWPDDTQPAPRRYLFRGEWHEAPAAVRDELAWLGPERQDRYERYGWNYPAVDIVGTGLQRADIPQRPLSASARARCLTLLRRAGIARLAPRRFLTLSYGERRLVLLARALAWRAQVLLLDEVATGLDAANRTRLYRLLDARALRGSTWICSAHRAEDLPRGATRLLWLEAGRVRYAGPANPAQLRAALAAARVRAAPVRRARSQTAVHRTRTAAGRAPGRTHAARPLITLAAASVYAGTTRLLRDIDLTIRRGECWVVHGANGAGKTTLLRTLYGDHGVASGGRIARAGIGPGVPLDDFRARTGLIAPHLQTDYPRHYTVLDTVVSGLHSSIGLNFRATPAEARRARRALAALGMEQFAARPLAELSYGQVRRVLFARALVLRPRLLLLDEPFTGLNPPLRAELLAWLEGRIASGVTVVMATHYRAEWPRNASHELHLSRGAVVHAGKLRA